MIKMIDLSMEYAKEMGLNPYYMYRQKHMLGNLENIGYAKKDMNVYIIFKSWKKSKVTMH